MRNYIIDTNILIQRSRWSKIWVKIEKTYFQKGFKNHAFISFASKAEAITFAEANKWGENKKDRLSQSLNQTSIIHSTQENLNRFYTQIDLYSQNRHKSLKLPKNTPPRNMGKNDIWIAASSAVTGFPLLSTDRDFQHLDGIFINFIYINPENFL